MYTSTLCRIRIIFFIQSIELQEHIIWGGAANLWGIKENLAKAAHLGAIRKQDELKLARSKGMEKRGMF